MARKLASIRTVKEVKPIENADAIECIVIDGWEVVSKKGEFSPGDTCVYFEIDSLLPEIPMFEFLRSSSHVSKSQNGPGFRLKTIRLRNQLSQGLALQPKEIADNIDSAKEILSAKVGDDVTDMIGVKLWERIIPAQLGGKIYGYFPDFMPKTDQERIQNCFDQFTDEWSNQKLEVTIKMDGSSGTYFFNNDKFGACSRNLNLKPSEGNSFWEMARSLDLENKMKDLGKNIAIQGELMGPGIQGNREGFEGLKFLVYNIYDIDKGEYLNANERRNLTKSLGLDHVPVVSEAMDVSGIKKIEEFLSMANLPSLKNLIAEGLVFKSIDDPSVSFKVISNEFLLNSKGSRNRGNNKSKSGKRNSGRRGRNQRNRSSNDNSNDDTGRD